MPSNLCVKAFPLQEVADSTAIPKVDAEIVVDALLGTGTKGKLKPPITQMVEYINALDASKSPLMCRLEWILTLEKF